MRSRFVIILFSCIVVLSLPAQGHIATVPVLASAPRGVSAGPPAMRPASPNAGEAWAPLTAEGIAPAGRSRYEASTVGWRSRASMPTARAWTRAAAGNNGKVYVAGGTDETNIAMDTLLMVSA